MAIRSKLMIDNSVVIFLDDLKPEAKQMVLDFYNENNHPTDYLQKYPIIQFSFPTK